LSVALVTDLSNNDGAFVVSVVVIVVIVIVIVLLFVGNIDVMTLTSMQIKLSPTAFIIIIKVNRIGTENPLYHNK